MMFSDKQLNDALNISQLKKQQIISVFFFIGACMSHVLLPLWLNIDQTGPVY